MVGVDRENRRQENEGKIDFGFIFHPHDIKSFAEGFKKKSFEKKE